VLGVVGALAFFNRGAIAAQLDAWHVLPKPEPFTEFYFSDYRKLQTRAAPDSTQQVAFTVHNHEHQTTIYHYKLVATAPGTQEQVITEGDCTAAHDKTCDIAASFALPALAPRVMVRATLTYNGRAYDQTETRQQTQAIHYWVTLAPSAQREVR